MISYFRSLDPKAALAGLVAVGLLASGIVLGSGNLRHYDPVLLTYTFGVLFSVFAVAYRYALWLQRPPTRRVARRAWEVFFRKGEILKNTLFLLRASVAVLAAHRFIRRRGRTRWWIHFLIAWGCLLAGMVTFPLVFGWLHFDSPAPELYRVVLFGVPTLSFRTDSPVRFVIFNLLNLSAVMVIAGAALSLHRRLREEGAMARQQFGNDIVPLILLLAISLTGLMLTFSAHALEGAGYTALSLVHALTVCAALLYLPFGKFFHVFIRPAHLGVLLCRKANESAPRALCRACAAPFAPATQVEDLKEFVGGGSLEICPPCRRKRLAA